MIVNKNMFPVQTGFSAITRMNERLSTLQVQLATGEKAGTLSEMGSSRSLSLSVRARQSAIEGFGNNIGTVKLRLSILDKTISRLDLLESEARTSATPSSYGTGDVNLGTVPTLSRARLDEVVTLLNTDVAGRHLFAGSETEQKPVPPIGVLLDGDGTKAGFRTVMAERNLADIGTTGMGRLTNSVAGAVVRLTEDGAHPFGLKLSTLSTTSSALTLTAPGGTPKTLAVTFSGQPLEGETVTVGFSLPDGSTEALTLRAVAGPAKAGEFSIGATPSDTAAAFNAALGTTIADVVRTDLVSASAFAAADMFFPKQGETAMRVAGPPYSSASALVAATPANTVQWYAGSSGPNPRQSVTARVDEETAVNYGVEGNESGLTQLVRSLAVMATQSFPSADTTSHARFDAMASRQMDRLGEDGNSEAGSIEMIAAELGMALMTTDLTAERHKVYGAQMDNLLADAEHVSKEEVAMEMLSLQTRLTASYQITATLSQLSLVNFIR